ncbi:MAG: Fe-S cluster assembly protein SufD [Chlorobiota bacterium]
MASHDLQTRLVETFHRWQHDGDNLPWSPQHPLRHRAIAAFQRLGFPTTRHEDWKYTSIAPLLRPAYRLIPPPLPEPTALLHWLPALEGLPMPHVWLLNGLPVVARLPEQGQCWSFLQNSEGPPSFGSLLPLEDEAFVALNTAFAPDAAFVSLSGDSPDEVLHVAIVTTAETEPQLAHPRLWLRIEPNAHRRVLVSFHSLGAHPSLTNAAAELLVGPGAHLELVVWETDTTPAYLITTFSALLEQHARLGVWHVALGGAVTRNNLYIRLAGSGADAQLFGAMMVEGQQIIDHRTLVEHRVEQCTSNQLYKSVADDQGTITFSGRIHVYPGAQKTNAYQSHRAVLLSEKATVNARPQLEIYADDVRCTHGATTGSLDEEALFYLRCRGIPHAEAQALLLQAFLAEAISLLPDEVVRSRAEAVLEEWAHHTAEVTP